MLARRFCDAIGDLDLFSAPVPTFGVKKRSQLFSWFGIFLTFTVVAFLFAWFIALCVQLARRRDPSFYNFEEPNVTSNQRIYIFNPNTFQMGFGLLDSNLQTPYIDDRIYTMKPILHFESIVNGNKFTDQITLDIAPCTAADFNNVFDGYNGLWCIKPDADFGKVYVTSWTDVWLEIQFTKCQAPRVCANEEDINNRLAQSSWVTYYPDYQINPLAYHTPLTLKYLQTPRPIALNQKKQLVMSIKRIDFESDNGIMIEDNTLEQVLTIKQIDDTDLDATDDGIFLTVTLVNSGIVFHYNRKYIKLPDILGQIFGLASFVVPIVAVLVLPFASMKAYEKVINEMFELQGFQKPKQNKGPSWITGFKRSRNRKNKNRKNDTDTKSSQAKGDKNAQGAIKAYEARKDGDIQVNGINIEVDENYVDPNNNAMGNNGRESRQGIDMESSARLNNKYPRLRINYFKWLKGFFVSDPEMEMCKQGKEIIENQIDLAKFIRKVMEIDKLKTLLLSKRQRVLFDNLPKPLLAEDLEAKKGPKYKLSRYPVSYEGNEKELKEAYKYLKDLEDKSDIDQKLLELYKNKINYD